MLVQSVSNKQVYEVFDVVRHEGVTKFLVYHDGCWQYVSCRGFLPVKRNMSSVRHIRHISARRFTAVK